MGFMFERVFLDDQARQLMLAINNVYCLDDTFTHPFVLIARASNIRLCELGEKSTD